MCFCFCFSSPACILSFFITAISRGEFKEAWHWTDAPEDTEDVQGKGKEGEGTGNIEQDGDVSVPNGEAKQVDKVLAEEMIPPMERTSIPEKQDEEKPTKGKLLIEKGA